MTTPATPVVPMNMGLYEIVMKLVGPVRPIGEARADDDRFENLKALTALTDKLLIDIDAIARENKNRHEYSMKRAGEFCDKFLDSIGIPKD